MLIACVLFSLLQVALLLLALALPSSWINPNDRHRDKMSGLADFNQAYFNQEAAMYDQKHGKTLDQMIEEIRARKDFIGAKWVEDDGDESESADKQGSSQQQQPVRFLDYACGTGVFSRALAPYVTQCVGIDVADQMVAAYNARAENQRLSKDEMHAVPGNLVVPDGTPPDSSLQGPEFFGFDIAGVGLGFHHFDDPKLAARKLADRLRPGGVLVVVDFLPHGGDGDGHEHGHGHEKPYPAAHTVRHHGFSEADIREVFEAAGAGQDFAVEQIADVVLKVGAGHGHGPGDSDEVRKRQVFIARGTKVAKL